MGKISGKNYGIYLLKFAGNSPKKPINARILTKKYSPIVGTMYKKSPKNGAFCSFGEELGKKKA